jgi:hypothetical protein
VQIKLLKFRFVQLKLQVAIRKIKTIKYIKGVKTMKQVMGLLIIDLLYFVVIEMVKLLVMGGLLCWGPSQYFKLCLIYILLLLCKVYPRYSSYCYVRSISIVLGRNPVLVDFVQDWQ